MAEHYMVFTRFGGIALTRRIGSMQVMLSCTVSGRFVGSRIAIMATDSHPMSADQDSHRNFAVWVGFCAVGKNL
jgi:hypothetical protein